jgi:hypothetical protein
MSDLVKRLRLDGLPNSIKEEAADHIEALEAALRKIVLLESVVNIHNIARAALTPERK